MEIIFFVFFGLFGGFIMFNIIRSFIMFNKDSEQIDVTHQISKLKQENDSLKSEIVSLKHNNTSLVGQISKLKQENADLLKKINQQQETKCVDESNKQKPTIPTYRKERIPSISIIKKTDNESDTKKESANTSYQDIVIPSLLDKQEQDELNTHSFSSNNQEYLSLSYDELLKKPEWYQKRSEMFAKKSCECEWCKSVHNLQLHHKYYVKYPNQQRVFPWDYPDKAFMVLCPNCHKKYHEKYKVKTYYIDYNSNRVNL